MMIDDHSRLAYAEVLDDLTAAYAIAFLRRAVAWFADRGVHVRALMSDNGSAYSSRTLRRRPSHSSSSSHLRIRPNRPRTNGKAERFIQTLLNEWAYAPHLRQLTPNEPTRSRLYLERYNYQRPHGSLGHQPPATRLNNLARNYI